MSIKLCKVNWSELDYQDNNDNLCFGLEVIEDEQSIDCFWFETDQERQQFILDNYMENNLIN